MDSTCLRIKFTPLLQNFQKDHLNHCLEIVPEITCIQNLNKIQWYKEENSIEYTIPMTYKVILRKKEISRKDDLNKTYYSCVDLLLSSSETNLTQLGSGDIKRIVSDTFVLTNVTTDVEKCSMVFKEANERNLFNNDTNQVIAEAQTNSECGTSTSCQLSTAESSKCGNESPKASVAPIIPVADILSESHVIQAPDVDATECLKNTKDQITITNFTHDFKTKYNDKPKRIMANVFTMKSKVDTKYKLSLTPICSIGTDDNIINDKEIITSNSFSYQRNNSLNDVVEIGNTIANSKAPHSYLYYDIFNMRTDYDNYNHMPHSESRYRILPEVRVANFVQQMEKEINPLKIMLSEIISKCSRLGYNKSKLQNSALYNKCVTKCEKQKRKCSSHNTINVQTKSNRVVYSIVFDG